VCAKRALGHKLAVDEIGIFSVCASAATRRRAISIYLSIYLSSFLYIYTSPFVQPVTLSGLPVTLSGGVPSYSVQKNTGK